MKVLCEYCQNTVEVKRGEDRICPYCGSPLPPAPEEPAPPGTAGKPASPRPLFLAAAAVILTAVVLLLWLGSGGEGKTPSPPGSLSVSDALAAINGGTADAGAYQVAVSYYLEGGKTDTAYQAARELLSLPDSAQSAGWCVQQFLSFDRPDLAARLAMDWGARTGSAELYGQVSGLTLDRLLPDSPLCQAMELVLGRTAGKITLDDLQSVTGLQVGRRDSLTGAQEIGVAFDGAGEEFISVTVESAGGNSGLGNVCFQGLRRLILGDTNLRTREDLALPGLRELAILLPMDAEDLTKFSHLTQLERLRLGGPSLTSLEGLDAFPALEELALFNTGLTDLSALAAQKQLRRLTLEDNGQLAGVASLSQAGQLRSLSLSGEALTDLSPLSSLGALEELSVTGTAIRDTAFLSGMTGLHSLTLTGNRQLKTVPELGQLAALERLTLDSDEMFDSQEDVARLAGLKALKLRVSKNLSFFQPLQALEELTIYSYQAAWDISGLAQFPNLKRLSLRSGIDFYDGYTASLEGLEGLKNLPLEELDLGGKPIYGPLDPVLEISTLQVLHLNGAFSQGTDYGKFANLTALRQLDLGGYRDMVNTPPGPGEQYWSYKAGPASTFVEQLGLLPALEQLSLAGCGVEDIGPLSALTGLTYLDLSDNRIGELSPLSGLAQLRFLDLSGNRIGDYAPVEGRDGLTLIR